MTILEAINAYLNSVRLSRSQNTARTYKNALQSFTETLRDNNLDPEKFNVVELSENTISWFARDLKDMSPSTESLYLTATTGFFEYLLAEQLCEVNLPRVRMLIRQRSRRPGKRLPQFPQKSIVDLLKYANDLAGLPTENKAQLLRNLRDRAFIITLAETGLRVHEACSLRRGDIDWNEGKALIVGKGNRQDVIRISTKA
ncbi:MAG: tyrosine-type recombinase/integrase, partial [Anaerolineales bacterium]